MTESQFLGVVEATLAQTEAAIDAAQIDADCAISGLVLTIELDDGARVVVNAQAPMRQLWLASRLGAMHFAWDEGGHWRDLRTGEEYFAALERVFSELLGKSVRLAP